MQICKICGAGFASKEKDRHFREEHSQIMKRNNYPVNRAYFIRQNIVRENAQRIHQNDGGKMKFSSKPNFRRNTEWKKMNDYYMRKINYLLSNQRTIDGLARCNCGESYSETKRQYGSFLEFLDSHKTHGGISSVSSVSELSALKG